MRNTGRAEDESGFSFLTFGVPVWRQLVDLYINGAQETVLHLVNSSEMKTKTMERKRWVWLSHSHVSEFRCCDGMGGPFPARI